uniref:arrestin domain-containing protein 3-like n=1 Tax=Scatophagus argus TaxID=75038 RepID=UPI001ED86360|nr:arrestin domain-containing protein 3-like [Scatophagus argus]
MSPIKNFRVIYEALNNEHTFTAGDVVVGAVTFTLTEETKLKKLKVKVKGEARVHWSEGTGERKRSHSAHTSYFKAKEYLAEEGTVLPQGAHSFNFKLKIPEGDMPSSFKGLHGKIVYTLEAKLSRSWKLSSFEQTELKFVSKSLTHHGQLMCPQTGSVDKEVGVFSKGQVHMSVTVDRKVCSPGDTLSIVAKICNSSSKEMTPKFSLEQKIVYRAHASTTSSGLRMCKMAGDTIKSHSEQTASCQLKIPVDAIFSLHNCDIISVEYYLKVYLDISFKIDPEVRLPLLIVPSSFVLRQPGEAAGPYPAGAVGAPSYSDFPPPAFPGGPYPVPAGPSAYGYPAPDPTQYANAASGYNSQWPQQVAPFGFSAAAFPPPSMQHQAPTAPPAFQQGELPTYSSLFPASHDTESDKKC